MAEVTAYALTRPVLRDPKAAYRDCRRLIRQHAGSRPRVSGDLYARRTAAAWTDPRAATTLRQPALDDNLVKLFQHPAMKHEDFPAAQGPIRAELVQWPIVGGHERYQLSH